MTGIAASADLVEMIAKPEENRSSQALGAYTRWLKAPFTPGVDTQSQGITTLENPPSWLTSALADVMRIAALPANWDSYGSPPVGETVRGNAIQLLASINYEDFPVPQIVPISGGALQMEWQYHERELELRVDAGSHEVLYLKVHKDDRSEEGVVSITDRGTIQALLDWLLFG